MSNEEAQKVLNELQSVRPEMLMGIFKDCEIKDVENCKKCIIKYFRKKYK